MIGLYMNISFLANQYSLSLILLHEMDSLSLYALQHRGQDAAPAAAQTSVQAAHQETVFDMDNLQSYEDIKNEAEADLKESNEFTDNVGELGFIATKMGTKFGLSSGNPFLSNVYDAATSLREMTSRYMHKFQKSMNLYWSQPKHIRYGLMEIALHCKKTNQKATQPGGPGTPLFYNKDGKRIKIPNGSISIFRF